jgi:hypothetical protein
MTESDSEPSGDEEDWGGMVFRDPVVWRALTVRFWTRELSKLAAILFITFIALRIFVLSSGSFVPPGEDMYGGKTGGVPCISLYAIGCIVLLVFFLYRTALDERSLGLYEKGVSIPYHRFVPYGSILRVDRVRRHGLWMRDVALFYIVLKDDDATDERPKRAWLPFLFLGEQGLAFVRDAVAREIASYGEDDESPDLVLYGKAGGQRGGVSRGKA